jgi:molybdopterin-guanine dinucleotide biosynthesis protein A
MKAAGFVLTGGSSTRMGRDKALLTVGGQPLCEYLGDVLSSVAYPVLLVGHPERYAHLKYRCIPDLHPDCGPMSGVESALSLDLAEFSIIVSCDIFPLRTEWLRALLSEAAQGASCAVVQDADGNVQPLCGAYSRACRAIVSRARASGRLRMMDLLQELNATRVKIEGVAKNLNTPAEYDEVAYDPN